MSVIGEFDSRTGILSFQGELTIYEANAASEILCEAFASGKLCKVDLAAVSELDSAGLQILLLARTLRAPDKDCVELVNHSEAVADVLELTGTEQAG